MYQICVFKVGKNTKNAPKNYTSITLQVSANFQDFTFEYVGCCNLFSDFVDDCYKFDLKNK